MPVEQVIGNGNKCVVPTRVARFVAPDKQDCGASRVESVQYPQLPLLHLPTQLFHIGMARLRNHVRMGPWKSRAAYLKQVDLAIDFLLLLLAEAIPPTLELVGV